VTSSPHPGCRIRSVRDKASGFVLHRLPNRSDEARISFLRDMRGLIDEVQRDGRAMVGYAVVLWDADLGSSASLRCGQGSTIPSIAMPDFVRNRLLAMKINEWGSA
jgi:hypothetical protein